MRFNVHLGKDNNKETLLLVYTSMQCIKSIFFSYKFDENKEYKKHDILKT